MKLLLIILGTTPAIGLSAFSYRPDGAQHAVFAAMAGRMGVPVTDPVLRILFDTWAVLMGTACAGLGAPGAPPIEPRPSVRADRVHLRVVRPAVDAVAYPRPDPRKRVGRIATTFT